jgi:hypothetical protein
VKVSKEQWLHPAVLVVVVVVAAAAAVAAVAIVAGVSPVHFAWQTHLPYCNQQECCLSHLSACEQPDHG